MSFPIAPLLDAQVQYRATGVSPRAQRSRSRTWRQFRRRATLTRALSELLAHGSPALVFRYHEPRAVPSRLADPVLDDCHYSGIRGRPLTAPASALWDPTKWCAPEAWGVLVALVGRAVQAPPAGRCAGSSRRSTIPRRHGCTNCGRSVNAQQTTSPTCRLASSLIVYGFQFGGLLRRTLVNSRLPGLFRGTHGDLPYCAVWSNFTPPWCSSAK